MRRISVAFMVLMLTLILVACGTSAMPSEDGVIPINRAELVAQFADSEFEIVQQSRLVDAIGRESTRTYTGVAIRDILAQHMDIYDIPPSATLLALSHDGLNVTYQFDQFMAETTLLAWYEDRYNDGNRVDVTRIVVADGLAALFLRQVTSLTLVIPEQAVITTTSEALVDTEATLNLPPLPALAASSANETQAPALSHYHPPMAGQTISTPSATVAASIPTTTASHAGPAITTSAITTRTTITTTTRVTTTTRTTPPTRPIGQQQQPGGQAPQTGSQTIAINRAMLINQFSGAAVTQQSHMTDSIGRESTRSFTGVPIRNVLAHHGINLNAVPAGATLQVISVDGASVTLNRTEFMATTTLLAWHEVRDGNQNALTIPRLVFPSGLSGRFLQQVATITITF